MKLILVTTLLCLARLGPIALDEAHRETRALWLAHALVELDSLVPEWRAAHPGQCPRSTAELSREYALDPWGEPYTVTCDGDAVRFTSHHGRRG